MAPALYLVRPPGVAALWEQDSWNAVGTAPTLGGGGALPAQARIHAPPRVCSLVPRSYLPGEVTVHSLDSTRVNPTAPKATFLGEGSSDLEGRGSHYPARGGDRARLSKLGVKVAFSLTFPNPN